MIANFFLKEEGSWAYAHGYAVRCTARRLRKGRVFATFLATAAVSSGVAALFHETAGFFL